MEETVPLYSMLHRKNAQKRELRVKVNSKNTCQESIQENQGVERQLTGAICKYLKDCQPCAASLGAFHISTISPKLSSPGFPTWSQPVEASDFMTWPREGQKQEVESEAQLNQRVILTHERATWH